MSNVRTYNPSVRVGNWNEDIYLEEDLLKDFLDKKAKGKLLVQQTHKLLDNILKSVPLSVSTDGFVHFGDKVMIVNPGQEDLPPSLTEIGQPRPACALAINMEEYKMYNADQVESPCEVSGTRILNPCTRNVFVITSVDGSADGDCLCFGQPFAISSLEGYAGNLKLFSDFPRHTLMAKKSRQQVVQLIDQTSYLTSWQVQPFHPQHRLECEGLPVPANAKLIVRHMRTGQKLFTQSKYQHRTPFGHEFEVCGSTMLDSHKAEKDNNHWVIVTGNPSDDDTTHFDRPTPQASGGPPKSAEAPADTTAEAPAADP